MTLLLDGDDLTLTMEDFILEVVDILEAEWDRRGYTEAQRWQRIRLMEQGMGITKEDN